MCRFASLLALLAVLAVAWSPGQEAFGQQSPWYEGFETPEATWRLVGGNAHYQVQRHQRVRGEAHTGEGSEHIQVAGTGGTEVFFSHEVGRPRVIDELLPTVWVKADRPGMQLVVQVVLPRTLDPKTQTPVSTLLQGSTYTAVGRWQQLRIEDIPRLLTRKSAVLRGRSGPRPDLQEAYVERVLLNVYGGPGVTNVWIDDLDIAGYVGPPPGKVEPPVPVPVPDWWPASDPAATGYVGAGSDRQPPPSRRDRIKMAGSVLTIDGRPVFPRIIQYQGEPLAFLEQLGFNAIWLPRLPGPELLQEARSRRIWVICPPPYAPRSDAPENAAAPMPEIGPEFDGVLAWDLGAGLGGQQLPGIRRRAEQLRAADRAQGGRPLVCRPDSELWAYSRSVPFLILGRSVLGTSLELSQYGVWLRERPRLALPDTPTWTAIPTQPAPGLRQQWAALGRPEGPTTFPSEQLRLAVCAAVGAGTRGILFESHAPLTAADPGTRERALALELLNLELTLVEKWAAAGNPVDIVPGSEQGVVAAELHAERARLLLPIWCAPGSQFVPGQSAGRGVWFMVPGVPEADEAYEVLPGAVHPVVRKRATLGLRVTLDEFGLTSFVLLTQDPRVITEMNSRAEGIARRAAEIQRELARAKLQTVAEVSGQLRGRIAPVPQADAWMGTARKYLAQCDELMAGRDHAGAYLSAERAMRSLRLVERAQWERATAFLFSPVASPMAVCYATLADHVSLMQRIVRSEPGPNLLPAGDFEDVGTVVQTGWQHFQHITPGVESTAEPNPAAAHSGRSGLRVVAQPLEASQSPAQIESPPVWIVSPPVPVEAGQLVRIQGWVRIAKPITGSVDGLLIVDSLGGEPLASRVSQTPGWQQFTFYRVATQAGPMTVTFALTGLGEAWLDEVTVQPLGKG